MGWAALGVVAAIAFAAACGGTRLLIPVLRRRALLDRPNARSSHVTPTPRGGGIAVVGAVLVAWLVAAGLWGRAMPPPTIMLGTLMLAAVSWIDDVRGLSAALRLSAQAVAVIAGIRLLPHAVFQGWLPPPLDALVAAGAWLWFVNLFNFMDGIDGIAGSEAAAIGIGIVLVAGVGASDGWETALPAAVIAAAAAGFLVWNWAPAMIFLGDVGSVSLGYLLGYLLLQLAARGQWRAALILPSYFLADATLTLLRRLARGERVWQAHREHFYQRAVQHGLGHAAVVRRIIAADAVLVACAAAAEYRGGVAGLAVAALTVLALLAALHRGAR